MTGPSPKYNGQAISQDSAERKTMPLCTGALDYFPAAFMELARHSFLGNAKHNGIGSELHWARGKSMDHADCIARHLVERGGGEWIEIDGQRYWMRHSAALLWRAAALLQEEMEAEGAAPGRASRFPPKPPEGWAVMLQFLNTDKKIAAIKLLRTYAAGDLGLKDAKDIVEGLMDRTLPQYVVYHQPTHWSQADATIVHSEFEAAGFGCHITPIQTIVPQDVAWK